MEENKAVAREVNRLYWETDQSVAEISNRLGVSRRALYELIDPSPTGAECRACGGELFFSNRSAKLGAVGRCVICGEERELEAAGSDEEDAVAAPYGAVPTTRNGMSHLQERAAAIAGFAIAGVVVGAIAALLIKRKH